MRKIKGRPNKASHETRRGGMAHCVRRGPVVEARLAGEGRCSTELWWPGHNGPEEIQNAK